jgi:hypothetical protein
MLGHAVDHNARDYADGIVRRRLSTGKPAASARKPLPGRPHLAASTGLGPTRPVAWLHTTTRHDDSARLQSSS